MIQQWAHASDFIVRCSSPERGVIWNERPPTTAHMKTQCCSKRLLAGQTRLSQKHICIGIDFETVRATSSRLLLSAKVSPTQPTVHGPNSTIRTFTRALAPFLGTLVIFLVGAASAAQPNLRVLGTTNVVGRDIPVPVQLSALGNENALSFSISFDPTLLAYRGETLGSG